MRPYGNGAAVTEGVAHRVRYGNWYTIPDLLIYRRKSKAVGREPDGSDCRQKAILPPKGGE